MNRLARLLGITLLIGYVSNPASASDQQPMKAPQPWYYGLGIGLALPAYNAGNIANDFAAANNTSSLSNDDFSFKLYGGYRLDPSLAVEFGISELGTAIATTSGISSKLFNSYDSFVNATMSRPYNDNATLFGKIGVHFWNIGPKPKPKATRNSIGQTWLWGPALNSISPAPAAALCALNGIATCSTTSISIPLIR